MADIFLSYAKEDRERAAVLAGALEALGWSVFWDLTIPAGETWDEFIAGELEQARCVVVAWSATSVRSKWVKEEARDGRDRDILVPVLFEDVKPPFGFGSVHAVDLSAWSGDAAESAFRRLVGDMERRIGRGRPDRAKAKAQARPEPPTLSTGLGAPTWEEDERLNPRIFIKGGEFPMGGIEGMGVLEYIPSFYFQQHPVTNEEFRRFDASHEYPDGQDRHPKVGIVSADAMAYAQWLGGSLPTEAQWEYAARGSEGRRYPWGTDPDPDQEVANFGEMVGGTTPVGAYPRGETPEGVQDMAGNVWEWCQEPKGLRGGAFDSEPYQLTAWFRFQRIPLMRLDRIGFRVAFWEAAAYTDEEDAEDEEKREAGAEPLPSAGHRARAVVPEIWHGLLTFVKKLGLRPAPEPPAAAPGPRPPTSEEDEKLNRRILIEGGEFLMGSPIGVGKDNEHPQHRVRVSSFYIQQHPVTNREYWRFAQHHSPGARAAPPTHEGPDHPVVNVDWNDAMGYAEWLGGSLPTEAQWEFAARGSEGRTYPCGEQPPEPEYASYADSVGSTTAVGEHPRNDTPEGLQDMIGNCSHWIRDWYGEYSGEQQNDPLGPETGTHRVVRGTSFTHDPGNIRAVSRGCLPPEWANDSHGFRVAFPAFAEEGSEPGG